MQDPPEAILEPDQPEVEEMTRGTGLSVLLGLLGLLGFMAGVSAVLIVIGVIIMIFFHELGHYVMAKRGGMKVTEFFLGFGPRIWSFHRGETEYGFKAIPAGAYVKIVGMNNLDDSIDPPTRCVPTDKSRTSASSASPLPGPPCTSSWPR